MQYLKPDIFVGCEIQTREGADSILTRSLNVYGHVNYASATFDYLNINPSLSNQLYYNTDKLTLKYQDVVQTSPRNIDHYVLYFNDPNLGTFYDTTFVEVYMCHLKAGSGTAEQAARAQQTQVLMDFIAQRPQDRHHFVCGDMNVYTSNEVAYQNFISGPVALNDPINSPGNWNSNSSFAAIHTQSTRNGQNLDCGSQGGADDRFDHILVSSNVMTGTDSLKYLANTYKAVGNDGNHYNKSLIQTPVNSMYPDSVVKALYYMSDHMPVTLKAKVVYPTSNGLALYPIIQNVSCYGANDGSATIVANDGQAPYSYQWDANAGNQTSASATGLSYGSYCVQVTDNLGETDDYCVFIGQPDSISYNLFQGVDNGSCSGDAVVLVTGGNPPYSIVWNPGGTTGNSVTGLCAGNYSVSITDANFCTSVVDFSISGVNGLSDETIPDFGISSNPTDGNLYLHFADNTDAVISICHLDGRIIRTDKINGISEFHFDLSDLSSGTYYLILHSGSNSVTRRIIKM